MRSEARDLLLVDGLNLFWRAAAAATLGIDGSPTGGVYAFIRALVRCHSRFGGEVVICWEGGARAKQARVAMYPEYKKRRDDPDPIRAEILKQLWIQQDSLKELLSALGVSQAHAPRWEADDVMATLAAWGERQGHRPGIFSGDSDMLQCASESTLIIRPVKKDIEAVTPGGVIDILGVRPDQVPLYKALAGDSSDGIPGVRGIGKVVASALIAVYPTMEGVLAAAREGECPKVRRLGPVSWGKLVEAAMSGELELWMKLATVNRAAPVSIERGEWDRSEVVEILRGLKFRSLLTTSQLYRLQALSGGEPDVDAAMG